MNLDLGTPTPLSNSQSVNYLFASCLGRVLAGMAAQNALAQRFEVALQAIGKLQASYRVLAGISMWKQVLYGRHD